MERISIEEVREREESPFEQAAFIHRYLYIKSQIVPAFELTDLWAFTMIYHHCTLDYLPSFQTERISIDQETKRVRLKSNF